MAYCDGCKHYLRRKYGKKRESVRMCRIPEFQWQQDSRNEAPRLVPLIGHAILRNPDGLCDLWDAPWYAPWRKPIEPTPSPARTET